MPLPSASGLKTLVLKLVKDGPHKTLPTPRRIRLLFKGACIVDTLSTSGAIFVWEHEHYPQYYLPESAFKQPTGFETSYSHGDPFKNDKGQIIATPWHVRMTRAGSEKGIPHVISKSVVKFADDLEGPASALAGLVKVNFDAVDQWLEEDTPIYVHPKDPFKRVDIIISTRPLRVSINGILVAETTTSMHLYETSLPVRYYMPMMAIDTSVLRPSPTKTQCPYKGEAEYYSVVVNGKEYKDIVWFYNRPTIECAAVAGMCCFYNEKVDIFVENHGNWDQLGRPETWLA